MPGAPAVVYGPTWETHGHFRCRRCGRVEDIGYALPPDFVRQVKAERGVEIAEALLTLNGVCAECRAGGKIPGRRRVICRSGLGAQMPLIEPLHDCRDCHIKPDLILIYRKPDDTNLELVRLGSHSELGL